MLDPDVVARGEAGVTAGAAGVASGAKSFAHLARVARPALVDGATGLVVYADGRVERILTFTFVADRITTIDIVTNPEDLSELTIEPV